MVLLRTTTSCANEASSQYSSGVMIMPPKLELVITLSSITPRLALMSIPRARWLRIVLPRSVKPAPHIDVSAATQSNAIAAGSGAALVRVKIAYLVPAASDCDGIVRDTLCGGV